MLGFVVTVLCLAALAAAAGIVFIAFGPVPVRRSVEMTPRMAPLPTAATPIALGSLPVFDPAQVTFSASKPSPPPLPRTRSARGTDANRRTLDDQPTTRVPTVTARRETDDAFLRDGN